MHTPEEDEIAIQSIMKIRGCDRKTAETYLWLNSMEEAEKRNQERRFWESSEGQRYVMEQERIRVENSYIGYMRKAKKWSEAGFTHEESIECGKIDAMIAIADRLDELCRILKSRDSKEGD